MTESESPIIGIDLGTTNSVAAVMLDGKVQVLAEDGQAIVPSIVGLTLDNKLIVGQSAKNQLAAFPERTISSVKRRMGENVKLSMGDQEYTPQEISAMILRRLKQRAETQLGCSVTRAVITVPAFFDENQRQATREAGQLAGLTVERIINEPTAASLIYHAGDSLRRQLVVYDLGGGTFDVSVVRIEDGVVEVLSSKGDTHLGGDDFDQLLSRHVADLFMNEHNVDLMEQSTTRWRLMQACERAKCELSSSISARISEEFITTINGQAVSLDVTVDRTTYEGLISDMIDRTITCVDEALRDASLTLKQIDELILVGGSTRTPLVQRRLREQLLREPKWAIDPDLAVALGAGTQAAMQSGYSVGPVLIDVATHSLGIEALGGPPWAPELVYSRIVHRNSPLPVRQEESFSTTHEDQKVADIVVYQGESDQLTRNRVLGKFTLEGLNSSKNADGQISVRFELTLDGTLQVTAVESATGLQQSIRIQHALRDANDPTIEESQQRMAEVFAGADGFQEYLPREQTDSESGNITRHDAQASMPDSKLSKLVSQAKQMRAKLSPTDAEDVDRLLDKIQRAQNENQPEFLPDLEAELDDLLFYLK